MPRLQKVWTCGCQLLVQGFYLHYSSCWFRCSWSDLSTTVMDNPANGQPVALMPRDQLPLYNQHGHCVSGSHMRATAAPRAATSSTASYITTPGPVLHDISHVYCEKIDDYYMCNVLEINYNQQLTNGMNPDYARELPAHYLKHWGLLVDTGAYVSVAPRRFAPEVLLEPVLHPVQLLTPASTPSRSTGQRQYYWFLEDSLSTFFSTSPT